MSSSGNYIFQQDYYGCLPGTVVTIENNIIRSFLPEEKAIILQPGI